MGAVTSYPSAVVVGDSFDVTFESSGLDTVTSYYVKALGGDSFNEVDTWSDKTSSWLQQNATWSDMPEFTTNNQGSASATLRARFENTSSGNKEFKIRIRKVCSSNNQDSSTVLISVTAATPTPSPTPSPTSAPTSVPTPTSTPSASPTKTPTPKPSPTKTPKPSPISSDQDEDVDVVLGLRDELEKEETPTPTPEVMGMAKAKFPVSSILFLLGGSSFIGLAGFSFFKQKKKDYTVESEESSGES